MERLAYFKEEIERRAQKERDAKVLIKVPGRLVKLAEEIVSEKIKKDTFESQRTARDFV